MSRPSKNDLIAKLVAVLTADPSSGQGVSFKRQLERASYDLLEALHTKLAPSSAPSLEEYQASLPQYLTGEFSVTLQNDRKKWRYGAKGDTLCFHCRHRFAEHDKEGYCPPKK